MDINLTKKKVELVIDAGVVRTLTVEDVHVGYVDGLNDAEVNHYLDGVAQSKQSMESVCLFVTQTFQSSNEIFFGIWDSSKREHCGTVRLHSIDSHHLTAHIGVCLFDKQMWGKGLASKAICAVTDWALKTLGLRWVEAGVYEENIASMKLFERCHYQKKYIVSGKYLLKGKPSDVCVYAACSEGK